jgi:hypothetical protein
MNTSRRVVAHLGISVLLCLVGLVGCGRTPTSDGDTRSDFDPANVPAELRDLAPFAKRWGIGDDALRADALERASNEERQALRRVVQQHSAEITRWLDSFGSGAEMPDEAAAFMYMQLAVEELPL